MAATFTVQAATSAAAAATGPELAVDVSAARHAISPGVYGLDGGDPAFNAEIGQSVALGRQRVQPLHLVAVRPRPRLQLRRLACRQHDPVTDLRRGIGVGIPKSPGVRR